MPAISRPRQFGDRLAAPPPDELRFRATAPVIGLALVGAVVLAFVATHSAARWAAVVVAAPAIAYWLTRQRGNGLLLATGILLLVPYWYSHVWLVTPVVGSIGLLAGVARTRLRGVDLVFGALVAVYAASWLLHRQQSVPVKDFVEGMLPFTFYLWARLMLTDRSLPRLQLVVAVAGGIAALSVLYEAARGTVVFADPNVYQWAGGATSIFRAGGVFGGSPSAAIVLAVALLFSIGLYPERRRLVLGLIAVMLAAIVATLDRAGVLGLACGVVLIAILWPYRRWGRVALAAIALTIPIYLVATSPGVLGQLSTTKLVSEGILRESTITGRVGLASSTFAVIDDSASHLLFGRGFDAMKNPNGPHDAALAVSTDLWLTHDGPNDDYLRAVLEQGLLGLILILAWFGGSLWLGIRTCVRLPKNSRDRLLIAGATAATLAYVVASVGHDLTHNTMDLSVAALITGLLVSLCSIVEKRREPSAASAGVPRPT